MFLVPLNLACKEDKTSCCRVYRWKTLTNVRSLDKLLLSDLSMRGKPVTKKKPALERDFDEIRLGISVLGTSHVSGALFLAHGCPWCLGVLGASGVLGMYLWCL